MGLIIRAVCSCGYTSKEIFQGHGGESYNVQWPANCASCRQIVTADPQTRRCSRCNGQIAELLGDPAAEFELRAEHKCPRCGKCTLHFEPVGIWD